MPKRLAVIGILFCIAGVLAIWNVIVAFAHQSLSFNFVVLLLPVGIGLLYGRMWARRWANVAIVAGYFFCGLLVLAPLLWPSYSHVGLFRLHITGLQTWPYFVSAALLLTIIIYLVKRVLYSVTVTVYLESKRPITSISDHPLDAPPPQD